MDKKKKTKNISNRVPSKDISKNFKKPFILNVAGIEIRTERVGYE